METHACWSNNPLFFYRFMREDCGGLFARPNWGLRQRCNLVRLMVTVYSGPDDTDHHFTGRERDQESGTDYLGAR